MSIEVTKLVGTVTFRRAIQVRQYEPAEALVSYQFEYDADAPQSEIDGYAAQVLEHAKVVALAALDLDGLSDDDAAARVAALTGGEVQSAAPNAATVEASAPTWPEPATFLGRNGKQIPTNEFKAWAKARFQTNPSEFFDNTADKNPNVKHKKTGVNVYSD